MVGTYGYNSDGIRISKNAGGITHTYYLDGSKIICEKRDDGTTLHFYYDENGNIFVTSGESDSYPCVVAHMDEKHDSRPEDWMLCCQSDRLFAVSFENGVLCGIGADDKNGIWVALKMLEKRIPMKAAFFVQEEIGCVGSSYANLEFFKDCRFIVECDRRDAHDFINNASGIEICSAEFVKDANLDKFGYEEARGYSTDVRTLVQRGVGISCCNLSCGYYNPHYSNEYTVFHELVNCLHFVEYIFENCTKVYPHEALQMW